MRLRAIHPPLSRRLAPLVILVAAVAAAMPTGAAAETPIGPFLASLHVIPSQYHHRGIPVSDVQMQAVSRPILPDIVAYSQANEDLHFQLDRPSEPALDLALESAAGQYQQDPDEPRRRLMLVVGLALGAAYIVFVVGWVWATRFRSGPRRH
jgi:hypothetical protein